MKEITMKNLLTATAAALIFATTGASAQEVCMPSVEMKAALIDWNGEEPVLGQARDNTQLWASERTGTWTLVKTLSDGQACVVNQGQNYASGVTTDDIALALAE
jgi:hypothetical protein